jgi:hypothetical protein
MEQQFKSILKPRLDDVQKRVGDRVGELMADEMKSNTQAGHGFGNDPYDGNYSTSHKNARRKRGLQTTNVDLRYKNSRIDSTQVQTTGGAGGSTSIRFTQGGEVFKMHHDGSAKGNKTRSIWPKTPESIPKNLKSEIKTVVGEVLRGQK